MERNTNADVISEWMVAYLSKLLKIDAGNIETSIQFDDFGLDSRSAVGMVGDLGDWLEADLDPEIIYDYSSIDELSEHVASLTQEVKA